MAPELLFPDRFGFTGKLTKQLPSKYTDMYAIGMTILEVSARPFPFGILDSLPGRFSRDVSRSWMSLVMRRLCSKS